MRPEAVEAMQPFLGGEVFGNPSGSHSWGRAARRALDDARDTLAEVLGAEPGEIVFTSGGTEADNLAVLGVLERRPGVAACTAVEHHAVLEPVERTGGRVVRVDGRGVVDRAALAEALDDDVAIVSVMLANNEIGTIQPLDEVAAVVRERAPRAVLHTDAVQALAWLDVGALAGSAGLISIGGHKIGGPKGIGALVVRAGTTLAARQIGGGQERDRRSGTQNVAGAVGLAVAARLMADEREARCSRIGALRDRLVDGLLTAVPDAVEVGVTDRTAALARRTETNRAGGVGLAPARAALDRTHKVAGSAHLCFPGVESEALLFLLDDAGIAASAGSSCASGAMEPSHVLAACGVDRSLASGALRLSLGWCSTDDDVDLALDLVPAAVRQLRGETS
jgi:cysteine desulfurase